MANRKGPNLKNIITKLDRVEELVVKLETENKKLAADSATVRMEKLEKELYSVMNIAMSMVAVNKEMIAKIATQQQDAVITKTPTKTQPVRVGDSSADVLSKIFSFFVKGKEDDKKKQELENDFRQERLMESRRKTRKVGKTATRVDRPSSNPILSLLGMIGSGIAGIVSFITGGLVDAISGGIGSIVSTIAGLINKIPGGSLVTGAVGAVGTIASWTVGKLAKFVMAIIGGSAGLIWGLVRPIVTGLLTTAVGSIGSVFSWLVKKVLFGLGEAFLKRLDPRIFAATILGGAYNAGAKTVDIFGDTVYGQESDKKEKEIEELKQKSDDPETAFLNKENRTVQDLEEHKKYLSMSEEDKKKYKQENFEKYLQKSKEYQQYLEDRFKEITPYMESIGYKAKVKEGYNLNHETDTGKKLLTFIKPDGSYLDFAEIGKSTQSGRKGNDFESISLSALQATTAIKAQETLNDFEKSYFPDGGDTNLGEIISRFEGNNEPVSTSPAPSITPQPNPPATVPVPTPPPLIAAPSESNCEIINMPTTHTTDSTTVENDGTPTVRNPFLFLTARQNYGSCVP